MGEKVQIFIVHIYINTIRLLSIVIYRSHSDYVSVFKYNFDTRNLTSL